MRCSPRPLFLPVLCALITLVGCTTEEETGEDLAFASGITWSPDAPDSGEAVTVRFTMSNAGDSTQRVEWAVAVDGVARTYSGVVTELASGASQEVSFTTQHASGTHTYYVTLDPDDDIDEDREDNNYANTSVSWSGTASGLNIVDATISSLSSGGATISFALNNERSSDRTAYWRLVDETANRNHSSGSLTLGGSTTSNRIFRDIESADRLHSFRIDVSDTSDFAVIRDQVPLALGNG
jgi:subtilase family serine protease